MISDSTKTTRKTKNRILAIEAAPAAMPPKPKTAAMMAMMKKMSAQRSTSDSSGGVMARRGERMAGPTCPP